MNSETRIIPADRHCVSCVHWTGVLCRIFRKRKEGTGQCSNRNIRYEQHPAFQVKKKSFEE